MPPQGWLIVGGLAWNYARSLHDKPTISQFARRRKVVAVSVWLVGTCWLVPHWWHE